MNSIRLVMAGTTGLLLTLGITGCATKKTQPTVAAPSPAEYSELVKPSCIYTDNMVLQREVPIRIAGFGTPGKTVKVAIDDHVTTAVTDKAGRWIAELPAMPAGGPHHVKISGKKQEITFKNVMIGEVWLCSGQSNMQFAVKSATNGAQEVTSAKHPAIRLFQVSNVKSPLAPAMDIKGGPWQECSPATVGRFSAVGYFFGRKLQHDLKIPIGLINSSWGGTPIESWIGLGAYQKNGQQQIVDQIKFAADNPDDAQQQFRNKYIAWEKKIDSVYAKEIAAAQNWKDVTSADAGQWKSMIVPGLWEPQGVDIDGVVWMRKSVKVPDAWKNQDLILSLGAIDDCDTTYFNGEKIGGIGTEVNEYWKAPRKYRVPARLVKPGENMISVRVFDQAYSGGIIGPENLLFLKPATDTIKDRINLSGAWQYRIEFVMNTAKIPPRPTPPMSIKSQNFPSTLYNAMIAPIVTYPIRGVIWYQGESNAGNAKLYRQLFPLLINSWREAWNNPNQVFLFAQLAAFERHTPTKPLPKNYFDSKKPGDKCNWAELREAQVSVLSLPRTGMAVTIDIGDPIDIHPTNKQDVGRRMALLAEQIAYGRNLVSNGPLYDHMKIEGSQIRLFFKHVGSGLVAKNGPLKCFVIAGNDGIYHWADATIEGETIVVKSSEVKSPAAVRYAWSMYPVGCNLYNKEGLPASPFRTDDPYQSK